MQIFVIDSKANYGKKIRHMKYLYCKVSVLARRITNVKLSLKNNSWSKYTLGWTLKKIKSKCTVTDVECSFKTWYFSQLFRPSVQCYTTTAARQDFIKNQSEKWKCFNESLAAQNFAAHFAWIANFTKLNFTTGISLDNFPLLVGLKCLKCLKLFWPILSLEQRKHS